jgi:hypothetical protein
MQTFYIIPNSDEDVGKMGVYRIWFGSKFYIGSTWNSKNRIESHIVSINEALQVEEIDRNSIGNIVRHIRENQEVHIGFFYMIEVCKELCELADCEGAYLRAYKGDPNCLNHAFITSRCVGNTIYRSDLPSRSRYFNVKTSNNQ